MPRTLSDAGQQADPSTAAATKAGLLTSKFTGVCWNKKNKRWQASINSGGKYLYLGSFQSENDAAQMFDLAAIKLRGTKTKINFPLRTYMDADGKLMENEALNATIAVHEQLVLTQKLATAQALALAGVTKKPRAGGGGAGTAAKKLTQANPASQGIITAGGAAAADGSSHHTSAAMNAAVTSSAVDQELLGHNTIAKHVNANFDLALLQQAATSAAASAAFVTAEQQRQQEQLLLQQQQYLQGATGFDLQQQQQLYAQQQSAMLMQQGTAPHMHQSAASSMPPAALGQMMQQLPLDMQHSLWSAGQGQAALQSAAARGDVSGMFQGTALQEHQQLQPLGMGSREAHLAALQGYLQDMTTGHAGTVDAAAPSSAAAYLPPMLPAFPPTTAANKRPASSSTQHTAAAFDIARDGVVAGRQRALLSKQGSAAAAAAVTNPAPLIRLSVLAGHLPAGGQLQLLVPGDAGLCGVIYCMTSSEADEDWGTALWDGTEWHAGGSFSSEEAAISACQFAVNFAKQLAVTTSSETVLLQQAAASAVPRQALQQQQQQQQPHSQPQQRAISPDSNTAAAGAATSHQRRLTNMPPTSSGSKAQPAAATTAKEGGNLDERSSLDDLAAAAAGALLEQQHMEWEQQQQQRQVDRTVRQHGKRSRGGHRESVTYGQKPWSHTDHPSAAAGPPATTTASANADTEAAALTPASQQHQQQLHRLEEVNTRLKQQLEQLEMEQGVHPAACLSSGGLPASQQQLTDSTAGVQQQRGRQQQQQSGDTAAVVSRQQQQYAQGQPPSAVAAGAGRLAGGFEQCSQLHDGGLSADLLQILQQVAGSEAVTPQQSLKLLDSLKPLMGLGSGSYESLLFSILGSNTAAAYDDETPLFTSQHRGITPSSAAAAPWNKVAGGRSQRSHQPETTTAPSRGAAVSIDLDDCGIFGGEAGRAAAAVAAAAAVVPPGDDRPASTAPVSSSLSPAGGVTGGVEPPASAAGDGYDNVMPLKAEAVAFGDMATRQGQHAKEAVPSTAKRGMEEPSVLGAYMMSMKAYEQEHQQQSQQQQHPSEEQKSNKRRRINGTGDAAQQTSAAADTAGQQDFQQQHCAEAANDAAQVWRMSAAAEFDAGGTELSASLKVSPSTIIDSHHSLAAASSSAAAASGSVAAASSSVAAAAGAGTEGGSGRLNCSRVPPLPQPSTATQGESMEDPIAEKASGNSLNSSHSLAVPVVSQAQTAASGDLTFAPRASRDGLLNQGGSMIEPHAGSPRQQRIGSTADCADDSVGGGAALATAMNDQLASLLAQMVASGHEAELVSLFSSKQLQEWLAGPQ